MQHLITLLFVAVVSLTGSLASAQIICLPGTPGCSIIPPTPTTKSLVANSDTLTVTSTTGGSVNILANDTANSTLITSTDLLPYPSGELAVGLLSVGSLSSYLTFDTTSGLLSVSSGVPSGSYTITYQICQITVSSNCVSGTVALTVTAPVLIATAGQADIWPADTLVNVLTGDTIGGVAATAGTVAITIVSDGGLTGLVANDTGQFVVPTSRAHSHRYSPTYYICQIGNLTNCSSTVTLDIDSHANLVATADTSISLTTAGGSFDLLANDTYDGAPATISNVNAGYSGLLSSPPSQITISNGALVVAPGAPAGTYSLSYRICELSSLITNGDCTSNVSINLTLTQATAIVATADSASLSPVATTITVLSNDTVGGVAATISNAAVTIVSDGGLTGLSVNPSGQLVVPARAAGTYSPTYAICQVGNLSNCSSPVTVIVTALAGPVAAADTATVTAGGTVNLLSNDTMNGVAATSSTVSPSITTAVTGFTINSSKLLAVASTVTAGTYSISYRICDVADSTNCSTTVTSSITVSPILATLVTTADSATLTAGSGGTVSILANDTYNAAAATTSNVAVSVVTPVTGFSINSAGQLAVASTVTAGSYIVAYKICDLTALTNCSGNTNVSVTVTSPPTAASVGLIANADGITMPVAGGSLNVLTNDRYNNAAVSASAVTLSLTSNGGIVGATLSSAGDLFIPVGLLPKAYALVYSMCLVSSPSTCTTGQVSIIISATATTAERKAPSVAGATTSSSLVITTGQSPISFGTGGAVAAGSINDPVVFAGVRASFGEDVGGLTFITLRQSQDIPKSNALLFYSGSGNLNARWEVIQPGDPDPNELDVVPEDGLTLAQRAQRHAYRQIGSLVTGYLAPMGSYKLAGPDPSQLPKNQIGTYRILLRLGTTGSGRSGAFYIPFITYRVQSDPIVFSSSANESSSSSSSGDGSSSSGSGGSSSSSGGSSSGGSGASSSSGGGSTSQVKSRFTANTSVADFSSIGQLDVGASLLEGNGIKIGAFEKKAPAVGFESINTKQPKAGQAMPLSAPVKFEWDEAKSASVEVWHLEVTNGTGTELLAIARVAKKTDYALAASLARSLPQSKELRWRVRGVDKDGNVTATSAWLFFTISN